MTPVDDVYGWMAAQIRSVTPSKEVARRISCWRKTYTAGRYHRTELKSPEGRYHIGQPLFTAGVKEEDADAVRQCHACSRYHLALAAQSVNTLSAMATSAGVGQPWCWRRKRPSCCWMGGSVRRMTSHQGDLQVVKKAISTAKKGYAARRRHHDTNRGHRRYATHLIAVREGTLSRRARRKDCYR